VKPESGHNGGRREQEKKCRGQISAKSGIANDRSPRGAPKEAKGGKASNESDEKERRCKQRRSRAAGVRGISKEESCPKREPKSGG
jgi:hypothetical protein